MLFSLSAIIEKKFSFAQAKELDRCNERWPNPQGLTSSASTLIAELTATTSSPVPIQMGTATAVSSKADESTVAAGLADSTSSAIDLIMSKTAEPSGQSQGASAIKNKFLLKSNITISLDNEDGVESPVLTDDLN